MLNDIATDNPGTIDDSSAGSWWTNLPAALRDIYLSFNQAEAQRKLIDLNVQRVAQGKDPINIDLASLRPGVQIGMSSDVKTLIAVLGVGAIAAIALDGRRRG